MNTINNIEEAKAELRKGFSLMRQVLSAFCPKDRELKLVAKQGDSAPASTDCVGRIYINPLIVAQVAEPAKRRQALGLILHELGHCFYTRFKPQDDTYTMMVVSPWHEALNKMCADYAATHGFEKKEAYKAYKAVKACLDGEIHLFSNAMEDPRIEHLMQPHAANAQKILGLTQQDFVPVGKAVPSKEALSERSILNLLSMYFMYKIQESLNYKGLVNYTGMIKRFAEALKEKGICIHPSTMETILKSVSSEIEDDIEYHKKCIRFLKNFEDEILNEYFKQFVELLNTPEEEQASNEGEEDTESSESSSSDEKSDESNGDSSNSSSNSDSSDKDDEENEDEQSKSQSGSSDNDKQDGDNDKSESKSNSSVDEGEQDKDVENKEEANSSKSDDSSDEQSESSNEKNREASNSCSTEQSSVSEKGMSMNTEQIKSISDEIEAMESQCSQELKDEFEQLCSNKPVEIVKSEKHSVRKNNALQLPEDIKEESSLWAGDPNEVCNRMKFHTREEWEEIFAKYAKSSAGLVGKVKKELLAYTRRQSCSFGRNGKRLANTKIAKVAQGIYTKNPFVTKGKSECLDTHITVLFDVSGSMDYKAERTALEKTAALFAATLGRMESEHLVTSMYSYSNHCYQIKKPRQRVTAQLYADRYVTEWYGNNDWQTIANAYEEQMAYRKQRRIIICVTDGGWSSDSEAPKLWNLLEEAGTEMYGVMIGNCYWENCPNWTAAFRAEEPSQLEDILQNLFVKVLHQNKVANRRLAS
jgi:hypothetical protein